MGGEYEQGGFEHSYALHDRRLLTALTLLSVTFQVTTLTRSATGTAIPGQTLVFSVHGVNVCQGTTNSSGSASCTVTGIASGATYTATFAGNRPYLPSSGIGQL